MRTEIHKDAPLVSVIVPAFNAAKTIEHSIRSVLAQTYPNFEILVVDDGSSDETAKIVTKLLAADDRINLLRQENQGVAAARNFGISHAKGQYIAPLDADDLWFADKLEKQLAAMLNAAGNVGLVYAWSVRITDNQLPRQFAKGWEQEGSVFLPLLLGNFLSNASTPLIWRACLDQVGLYNTEFLSADAQGCEDWDIYLRIAEQYEFRVVPEHLTVYRRSLQNMSADWLRMARSYNMLMEGVRKRHPDIPAHVFRWSRSNYYLYLANKATQAQQNADSLKLLSKAIALDPCISMNRLLQRMFAKNLLRGLRKPDVRHSSGNLQDNPIDIDQICRDEVKQKPVTGGIWTRLMTQRTHQLLQIQKELTFDVNPSRTLGEPKLNL